MAEIRLECSCHEDNLNCTMKSSGRVEANITANYDLSSIIKTEANVKSSEEHLTKTPLYDILETQGSGPYYTITLPGEVSHFNKEKGDAGEYEFVDIGDTGLIEFEGESYYYEVVSITGNKLVVLYTDGTNGDVEISSLCEIPYNEDMCYPKIAFFYENDNPYIVYGKGVTADVVAKGDISSKASLNFTMRDIKINAEFSVSPDAGSIINPQISINSEANITTFADKFAGDFEYFTCVDKLYPTGDVTASNFITSDITATNLYSYIDEGVFVGDYRTDGYRLSDDTGTYIQASSVNAEGDFYYKCLVTKPSITPDKSRLYMRLSAPHKNQESYSITYNISGIELKDPDGKLLIKYEDQVFRGDSTKQNDVNYTTLSLTPSYESYNLYEWQGNHGDYDGTDNYTLEFYISSEDNVRTFTQGFTEGFQFDRDLTAGEIDGVLGSLRISSIEICNSGHNDFLKEQLLPFALFNNQISNKIERCIRPSNFQLYDYDTGIYPTVSSIWKTNEDEYHSNIDIDGSKRLLKYLKDGKDRNFITLEHMGPLADSGKLTLKFSHSSEDSYQEVTPGAFAIDFDQNQSLGNMWFTPSGAFNTLNKTPMSVIDNFFIPETISLRVKAKKAVDSRDYFLDVVGYSDDCVLNVTSASCGFLQNSSGVFISNPELDTLTFYGTEGSSPDVSGYRPVDDLGISTETISDRDQYYESNECDDHRLLSTYPRISSTEFQWYEIPLQIFDDEVTLGRSRNYNLSSMLESLYLDIFPLPSGASIADIQLCIRYSPQGAFNLITQGGEYQKIDDGRRASSFYTTSRQSNDNYLNAGTGYNPLSLISGIPHAYCSPETLKTNYSRRWRGMVGLSEGPYNINQFGFGFESPHLDTPLFTAYFDFSNLDGSTFTSKKIGQTFDQVQAAYNNLGISEDPETFRNLGLRFSSGTMFNDILPGYSGLYKTADWTSLSSGLVNFEDHELYGNIFDGYDNLVRFGNKNSLQIEDINITSGVSLYLRFIPDANVSGQSFDFYDQSNIITFLGSPSLSTLNIGFSGGYLYASGFGDGSHAEYIQDTTPYSGYQYPLSVLVTYDDNSDRKIRLYTENELYKGEFTNLRATSGPIDLLPFNNLYLGYNASSATAVDSGFPMLVSEFAYATPMLEYEISGCSIVESEPDKNLKQISAQQFFENQRVKFFDPDESYTEDNYKLWDYVNENTYSDWSLGEFRHREFNQELNSLSSRPGKRTGRDLVRFDIQHHGSGYSQYSDIQMPSSVDSGVAYHSQIENDFIRFHISDTYDDHLISTHHRVAKSLPRGYSFKEKALVVESVIEHRSETSNIVWEDGNTGPKFIVSLYTTAKDPTCTNCDPTQDNFGLINRDTYYLPPSSCMFRFDSVFDYDSICDKSENWALFNQDKKVTEFNEKYYSTDIDDMFVQLDLVYPSGPAFSSSLDVHSVHVRAEDAWVDPYVSSGVLNLAASGGNVEKETLGLFTRAILGNDSGVLNLSMTHLFVEDSGNLPLYTFGAFVNNDSLPLAIDFIDSGNVALNLVVAPADDKTWQSFPTDLTSVNLNIYGVGETDADMPMTVFNIENQTLDNEALNFTTWASEGDGSGVRNVLTISLINNEESSGDGDGDQVVAFFPVGQELLSPFTNFVRNGMNMVLRTSDSILNKDANGVTSITKYDETGYAPAMPLVVGYGFKEGTKVSEDEDLNLYMYNLGGGDISLIWNNENYGVDINAADESGNIPTISPDDEIRGVDLFGYGTCDGNSPKKAIDAQVVTDDTVWAEEICHDGGIFRATNTYTNLEQGYSGNYYGIRKYEGLEPNSAYKVNLRIKTGSTDPIEVPRDWEEWNYGICGPDWHESGCCTVDCDQNINYSGTKLISDYPYLSGDATHVIESGRQANAKYGTAVTVKGNLLAVGSPYHNVIDDANLLVNNAGSVFLYRRQEDVAGKKAPWFLEDQLQLPEGFIRDYSKERGTLVTYQNEDGSTFSVSGQKWYIGQEGRQLGYSLDIAQSGSKETIVAGAPGAEWSRTFPDIEVSGIPVFLMVFTDKFTYRRNDARSIGATAKKYDILYKYFSQPWVLPNGSFNPKIDLQLLICEIYPSGKELTNHGIREPWFNHIYLNSLREPGIEEKEDLFNYNYSGILNKFNQMFPYTNEIYSGIPPIVGIFGDNSESTHNGVSFQRYIDSFKSYYTEFALASGVEDLETSTPEDGYITEVYDDAFNWKDASIKLMNDTLATGNLDTVDALKYITSGIGQQYAQQGALEFQMPPDSGGRVYIFDKEGDKFNFVQELISPEEVFDGDDLQNDPASELAYGPTLPSDRFGHAVAISKNGEIIAVGSPYSAEACRIYERDETENDRMYGGMREWLEFRGHTSEATRYDELLADSGFNIASRTVYLELTQGQKYHLRSDDLYWGANNGIKLYKQIFKYHYNDIKYQGTWQFLPGEFAGTSRLGYSAAVNDEGDIVAFGAPTDSFNQFEDVNVWGEGENTWASYVNAGAVRVFESRRYYDHTNKVVEFYKFGNYDEEINKFNPDLVGEYNKLGEIFAGGTVPRTFERTAFSEIEIPTDAGLAFIITPQFDAASDEIIDNIKSWLALGDRTLVLVGNDPTWENNGIYHESNQIINKILEKIGCRMRIIPARSQYDSLPYAPSASDIANNKFNVTQAHMPKFSHDTYIPQTQLYAQGVADIKIDLSDIGREDLYIYGPCDDNNPTCSLPIKHSGDLRAEWESKCADKIEYYTNWAFHFDNDNPAQGCKFYPEIVKPEIRRPDEDIKPILTAAEYIEREPLIIPASSGTELVGYKQELLGYEIIKTGTTLYTYEFAENQLPEVAFSISQTANGEYRGDFLNVLRQNDFVDPDRFDYRNSIVQGVGKTKGAKIIKQEKVADISPFVVRENHFVNNLPTSSDVVIIAGLQPETKWSLGKESGDEYQTNNDDKNISFFNNLVVRSCDSTTPAKIVQLGGWTQRSKFKDAYEGSFLDVFFLEYGHEVVHESYSGNDPIDPTANVLWIANANGSPTDQDVERIQNWLKLGNKRLVVTYDANKTRAGIVENLLSQLGFESKPYSVTGYEPGYAVQITDGLRRSNEEFPINEQDPAQTVLKTDPIIKGCQFGYSYPDSLNNSTEVGKLAIIPTTACPPVGVCRPYEVYDLDNQIEEGVLNDTETYRYIPINAGQDAKLIVTIPDPIYRKFQESSSYWELIGSSDLLFNCISGSGYRIHVNWVSETEQEDIKIFGEFSGAHYGPDPESSSPPSFDDEDKLPIFDKTPKNQVQTKTFDLRASSESSVIKLSLSSVVSRIDEEDLNGSSPFTPRIVSVYGYPLPIEVTEERIEKEKKKPIYSDLIPIYEDWYIPEQVITYDPEFRPISTWHGNYCDPDGFDCNLEDESVIEDGPVIVAEELEHFTKFTQGAKRSRIVLITDSSIIQGKNPQFRQEGGPNVDFIRSLYPPRPEEALGSSQELGFNANGRNFSFTQKIRSPETSSPAKYYAVSGLQGLVDRFGFNGVAGNLDNYTSDEDNFHPADVVRRFTPVEKKKIDQEIERFGGDIVPEYGTYPRFSGMYGEETETYNPKYVDAGIQGGFSRFFEENGYDYIDYASDVIDSGFLGDLFGFSIAIDNDQLVVGTPFSAVVGKEVKNWSGIKELVDAGFPESGYLLSDNGGPGAAYYFQRTGRGSNVVDEFLPWEFKQKIKHEHLNVGLDNATAAYLTQQRGQHNLPDDFVEEWADRPDMFGYSVSIDSDFIAIGAPNHDYGTLYEEIYSGVVVDNGLNTAFLRKSFGTDFDIPGHRYYDLADSGIRVDRFNDESGIMVLNNGAVFTFRNIVTNWGDGTKEWQFVEKLIPQGFSDRNEKLADPSGTENDSFGFSVSIHRSARGDSDYTLVGGAPYHNFPTSGNHITLESGNAGAVYTWDAMLREQQAAIPGEGGYIDAQVFGRKRERSAMLRNVVYQPSYGDQVVNDVTGVINSNKDGNIYLEVSGYDPSTKGFVAHRPYVEFVFGELMPVDELKKGMRLFTGGRGLRIDNAWPIVSGLEDYGQYDLNYRPSGFSLSVLGPDADTVYNNIQLVCSGGYVDSGILPLHLVAPSAVLSDSLWLSLPSAIPVTENLNLRVRGK